MKIVQLEFPHEYQSDINFIKSELADIKKNFQPKKQSKYIRRKALAEMLNVDQSSICNWTKKGILTAYQISGLIYYRLDQVEKALVKLKR